MGKSQEGIFFAKEEVFLAFSRELGELIETMTPFFAELIGTAILLLLGDGVVANVLLNKSKAQGSGWIVITAGWAVAVFVAVFAVGRISGAHLNPAVTIGMAVAGNFPWSGVLGYVLAQVLGAMLGAVLVWISFYAHWKITDDPGAKLAIFCTGPAVRNAPANFATEVIGTFLLLFGVFCLKGATGAPVGGAVYPIDLGALGALPVALLVFGIGLSLGGPTGYAINPARDFGPRLAHFLLPIPGKGSSDWGYAWVPICGPIVGGAAAAFVYVALGKF